MNMRDPLEFATAMFRGRLVAGEPMARHVSWRAGGSARQFFQPADSDDLLAFLRLLPRDEPLCFLGLGSNLLVRDGGFHGTVIRMHAPGALIRLEGERIWAAAGAASPKLARFAATHGFEGAEFFAGVPGTVGGALAMNAGCHGAETWEHVDQVQTVDRDGILHIRGRSDFDIGYRHCRNKAGLEEWFTGAWLRFQRGDALQARERIRQLLAARVATQPLDLPNAGSVFRNPPGDHAARLIEACGLKGHARGGARISEKHANFIVNPGGKASAADIEALIALARHAVQVRFSVDLVPEVRIIGEAA